MFFLFRPCCVQTQSLPTKLASPTSGMLLIHFVWVRIATTTTSSPLSYKTACVAAQAQNKPLEPHQHDTTSTNPAEWTPCKTASLGDNQEVVTYHEIPLHHLHHPTTPPDNTTRRTRTASERIPECRARGEESSYELRRQAYHRRYSRVGSARTQPRR